MFTTKHRIASLAGLFAWVFLLPTPASSSAVPEGKLERLAQMRLDYLMQQRLHREGTKLIVQDAAKRFDLDPSEDAKEVWRRLRKEDGIWRNADKGFIKEKVKCDNLNIINHVNRTTNQIARVDLLDELRQNLHRMSKSRSPERYAKCLVDVLAKAAVEKGTSPVGKPMDYALRGLEELADQLQFSNDLRLRAERVIREAFENPNGLANLNSRASKSRLKLGEFMQSFETSAGLPNPSSLRNGERAVKLASQVARGAEGDLAIDVLVADGERAARMSVKGCPWVGRAIHAGENGFGRVPSAARAVIKPNRGAGKKLVAMVGSAAGLFAVVARRRKKSDPPAS